MSLIDKFEVDMEEVILILFKVEIFLGLFKVEFVFGIRFNMWLFFLCCKNWISVSSLIFCCMLLVVILLVNFFIFLNVCFGIKEYKLIMFVMIKFFLWRFLL